MSLEQLATEREPIATTRRADADISEPPELHRSSYQSPCNEVLPTTDAVRAALERSLRGIGRDRSALRVVEKRLAAAVSR